MNELSFNILTALVGGALGFGLNWFLAERQERYELRRSIAQMRVETYKSLWVLCKQELEPGERNARVEALSNWYDGGGGLFLSLAATERLFRALKLMRQEKLTGPELVKMQDNLTWLRTEMKYHVGSYTWREKNTPISDAG